MCRWDCVAADWGVLLALSVNGHRFICPTVHSTSNIIVGHFGLVRHCWRKADYLRIVINDSLMVDLDVRTSLSNIVHQLTVVRGVFKGILCCVLGVNFIVRRVFVVFFHFLQCLCHYIFDRSLLLRVCESRFDFEALLLSVFEHCFDLVFRFLFLCVPLQLADIGVIGNFVHLVQNPVHERVETLHDIKPLLELLDLSKTVLDLFKPW